MKSYFEVYDHEADPIARLGTSWIDSAVAETLEENGFDVADVDFITVQVYLNEPVPEDQFANGDVYQVTFPSGGVYTYFRHNDKWTGNMSDESMATWVEHGRAVKCQVVPVES